MVRIPAPSPPTRVRTVRILGSSKPARARTLMIQARQDPPPEARSEFRGPLKILPTHGQGPGPFLGPALARAVAVKGPTAGMLDISDTTTTSEIRPWNTH